MRLGLLALFVTYVLDQAHKTWMIHVYRIEEKGAVSINPFLDLVMVWNRGLSYGLFQQEGLGIYLLAGFKIIAGLGLVYWLTKVKIKFEALCIGLIAGGAFGNATDSLIYGAVADFFAFKIESLNFHWYVFNVADMAIVGGVFGLIYLSFKQPSDAP